ncbi:MAG TPA: DUF4129 domain-containing protein [Chryseolinea sp.]|nr:DUF4129 domain-containing protein [Chryseolinea sp.]
MLIGTFPLYGQVENSSSEKIDVRRFDHDVWKEVVGSTDYSEDNATAKRKPPKENSTSSESSTARIERSEDNDGEDFNINLGPGVGLVLNLLAYALILGAVGYILFLIVKNLSLNRNVKTSKTTLPVYSAPVENIRELEIDKLLREALASANYRLAVRIYFLGMLKRLDEAGFILWKKDKTNRDYLSELFSKELYFDDVKKLTLAYEQVWYGEHDLPLHRYEEIIISFKAIDQKLQSSKPA